MPNEILEWVLNPYLYTYGTLANTYVYSPYRHTLLSFSTDEWNRIKEHKVDKKTEGELIKNKVYVEKDYKKRFLEKYRAHYSVEPKLGIVYIIATDSCNFNCSYCFIENNFNTEKRRILDLETVKKWVDYAFLNSGEELRFIFYGGEPLLNKGMVENALLYIKEAINKYEHKKTLSISINTNGSVYDQSLSKIFRDTGTALSISIDGPKEIHDKCRISKTGEPTFEKVIENVERYIKDGVIVNFSITITDYNLNYLPQIAKWVVENYKGKINGVGFNPPLEATGALNFTGDFKLVMLQIYNAFRIFKKYGIYEDRIMRRMKKILDEIPHLKDCAGCGSQIVVSANGEIGPCQAFIGTGKFFKKADAETYDFSNDETIKSWNFISPINKQKCEECPFILLCGNGCPYYSYIKEGDLMEVDRRYCEMLPIMMNEVLKDNFYPKPKALFLDFDDTILLRRPMEEVLKELGNRLNISYTITPKEFYEENGGVMDMRKYFKRNGIQESDLDNVIREYMKAFDEGARPNIPLLNQLKKIDLPKYILTNAESDYIEYELNRFGMRNLFSGVFGNDKYQKPLPDFYRNAFNTTNLSPEEVIYIGDYKEDIFAIYKFGCRAVLFAPDAGRHNFENDWLVDLCKN
ncbi:MAG: HAD hydrolase-like protein [Candidatus Micrarchaeaceae archaeon]